MHRRLFAAIFSALVLGSLVSPAAADSRLALVIGNGSYAELPGLVNPGGDAAGIAKSLKASGFEDVTLILDADLRSMHDAVELFANKARDADVALIYFAGHGVELAGANFLIPTDAKLKAEVDLPNQAIDLNMLVRAVGGARRLGLIMLDACRNNPFTQALQSKAGAQRYIGLGLAPIEPAANTLVAYAARTGTPAADGDNHSPFADALIKRLPTPGLEISLLLRQVRDDVIKFTDNRQQPVTYGTPGGEPFYFVPVPVGTHSDAQETEIELWRSIENSTDSIEFEEYLRLYPNGNFADIARRRVSKTVSGWSALSKSDMTNLDWSRYWGKWIANKGIMCLYLSIDNGSPPQKIRFAWAVMKNKLTVMDGDRLTFKNGARFMISERFGVLTMRIGQTVCNYHRAGQ